MEKYNRPVPRLTTQQMIEVDRLMIEKYKIALIQMMENAGRGLAIVAKSYFLNDQLKGKKIIVLAGTGGNGGGAMVAARRLTNWGAMVKVFLTAEPVKLTPVPRHQYDILKAMKVPVESGTRLTDLMEADLILDGIIGYSISGDPYGVPKLMIDWANRQKIPTLSLDTPSGLDLTSATVHQPTIKAEATVTLALPKVGLFDEKAIPYRGDLFLADISVPPGLYQEPTLKISLTEDLFETFDVIRID